MATIKWVESVPSNASLVGRAPTDFKSVWTAMSAGLAVEHYWPGTGGGSVASAGDLLPGGTRTYVQSSASGPPMSSSQLTGRLSILQNSALAGTPAQRLVVYESAGTFLAGTSFLDEAIPPLGDSIGTWGYWLRQTGAIPNIPTGSGTTNKAFPVVYTGTVLGRGPRLTLTSSSASWILIAQAIETSGFTSAYSSYANAASTVTLYWEALGVVSSGNF